MSTMTLTLMSKIILRGIFTLVTLLRTGSEEHSLCHHQVRGKREKVINIFFNSIQTVIFVVNMIPPSLDDIESHLALLSHDETLLS